MVLLLLPVAAAVAALSAAICYKYFQRQFPTLTDDDLPRNIRGATAEDKVTLHVVSELTASEKDAMYKAFHNGQDFQWVANYDSTTTTSSSMPDKEKEAKRWKLTQYMIDCIVTFGERYGHTVVARSRNGDFLGALCIIPPYQSHRQFDAHFMKTVVSLGKPPTAGMGTDVEARFSAFGATLEEHHTIMKDCKPHWYVGTLGVSEAAQGKGVGRILNHVAIAMAKGAPLYLDCHNGNVEFYNKMGYEVRKQIVLVPKTDNPVTFPFNGMTHGYQLK